MPDGTNNTPPPAPDGATSKPDGPTLEELKKELDALKKDRDDWKGRFESDKSERDAAKRKAREEAEKAREEAEKRGEHEKVIEQLKADIATYKPIADQFESLKAERDALVQARKDELLAQIPEDQRQEWQDADVNTLSKVVKLASAAAPVPGTHSGGSGAPRHGSKAWNDMTSAERMEYTANNSPADVQAKIRESRAKR